MRRLFAVNSVNACYGDIATITGESPELLGAIGKSQALVRFREAGSPPLAVRFCSLTGVNKCYRDLSTVEVYRFRK
jgi:hypothetical protein